MRGRGPIANCRVRVLQLYARRSIVSLPAAPKSEIVRTRIDRMPWAKVRRYMLLLNLRLAHAGTYTHLSRRPRTRVGPKRDPRVRPTHRGFKNRSCQTRAAPELTPRRPTTRPTSRPPLDAPRAAPTRAARGQTPAHGWPNASTARQGPKSRPATQEAFQGQTRASQAPASD